METKEYNVYKFKELTAEAKEKAIESCRDINTDYDWYQFIFEDWTEKLERQGFLDARIYFSGFYSQGDGACFTCKIDLEKLLTGRRLKSVYKKAIDSYNNDYLSIEIKTSGHYSHEYTMSLDYYDQKDVVTEKLADFIITEARNQAQTIYKELKESYEYLTSNESIIETIESNDYDFTVNGKID